jgi:hypothetical protein
MAVLQLDILAAACLDRAGTQFTQHVAERKNLLFIGPQCRDWNTLRIVVALLAGYREAEGTRPHAVADGILHRRDLLIAGALFLAVLAHDVVAHCGVADQVADIDAEAPVEMVHVLADRLPVERDRTQHLHRDRLDIREEFGQPFLGALAYRRQRQRAVAEDDRGRAMLGRERTERIPGDLRVIVAMVVDKAGSDGTAVGVDRAFSRTAQLADFGDLAVFAANIAAKPRLSRAVDNEAILDQQIVCHRFFLSLAKAGRRLQPEGIPPKFTRSRRRNNALGWRSRLRAMFCARRCQAEMRSGLRQSKWSTLQASC